MRVKLAQAGGGWGVHAHLFLLHLPSPVKLQCTLQLSGQIHWPVSSLVKIWTLWAGNRSYTRWRQTWALHGTFSSIFYSRLDQPICMTMTLIVYYYIKTLHFENKIFFSKNNNFIASGLELRVWLNSNWLITEPLPTCSLVQLCSCIFWTVQS